MTQEQSDNVSKKHLRGSVLLFGGRMVGVLLNFVTQILAVRYLSKADYGVYGLAVSVVAATALVTAFGFPRAASRYFPIYLEHGQTRRFRSTLWLMLGALVGVGSLIVLAVILSWQWDWGLLPEDETVQTVVVILIFLTICNAMDSLLVALFAVLADPWAIFYRRHLVGPGLKLAGAAIVVGIGGDVFAFAIGQLIAGLIGMLVNIVLLWQLLRNLGRPQEPSADDAPEYSEILGYSGVLFLSDVSFLLRGALIPVFISFYHAREQIAAYQAVLPVAKLNELVLVTFTVMFVPGVAKLFARRDFEEMAVYQRTFNVWVVLLTFPMFILCFAGAERLTLLLFGEDYRDSADILAVLALGFFVNAALGSSLRMLRVVGSFRMLLGIDLLVAVIALGLNFWLIPPLGAWGGALAAGAAYALQSVLFQWSILQTTGIRTFSFAFLAPFVYAVLVAVGARMAIEWGPSNLLFDLLIIVAATVLMTMLLLPQAKLAQNFPELRKIPGVGTWLTR